MLMQHLIFTLLCIASIFCYAKNVPLSRHKHALIQSKHNLPHLYMLPTVYFDSSMISPWAWLESYQQKWNSTGTKRTHTIMCSLMCSFRSNKTFNNIRRATSKSDHTHIETTLWQLHPLMLSYHCNTTPTCTSAHSIHTPYSTAARR